MKDVLIKAKQLKDKAILIAKQVSQLWPGMYGVPFLLIAWILSPYFLRLLDSTAATFDAGVLQIYLYAAIGIVLFNDLSFLGIKMNFPVVFQFYKEEAGKAFKDLTSWQKIVTLVVLYLGLLLAFVLLASVMLSPTQGG
jgi:hypothetical protein